MWQGRRRRRTGEGFRRVSGLGGGLGVRTQEAKDWVGSPRPPRGLQKTVLALSIQFTASHFMITEIVPFPSRLIFYWA